LDAAFAPHLLNGGKRDENLAGNDLVVEFAAGDEPAQRRHGHAPVRESQRRSRLKSQRCGWR